MAHHQLRKDRTCQNCNYVVENKFCSRCGQENIETRQSFGHLVIHFFEDFTHYDNYFWKTIKTLLFRPSVLTKEYLTGKRQLYVPPVKLYIFISFITFLLWGLTSSFENKEKDNSFVNFGDDKEVFLKESGLETFPTVKELDSVQNSLPESKKSEGAKYWMKKKLAKINENYKSENFKEKLEDSFLHNLPKALFLYLPFFALNLWIFHGKKRWYFFDHGIFTLHYFSFILFTFTSSLIINFILDLLHLDSLFNYFQLLFMGWWFFYFFRSHRRFYGESKLISRLKGIALFFINILFISIFLLVLIFYGMVNMH
ncbi:DUF3667 domain-containing protein [Flavobacterium sp. '19STA2R22 D10 B1']|uniref:DUF3667 domain-containing protein n=1 Tax=Flavobacterium aerium TaxID=3037261 RepID=UPI00278BE82B|nr:DUF3667 domain-containing protein [Flavobacterium sp. '19STA2R22 D10 B1']